VDAGMSMPRIPVPNERDVRRYRLVFGPPGGEAYYMTEGVLRFRFIDGRRCPVLEDEAGEAVLSPDMVIVDADAGYELFDHGELTFFSDANGWGTEVAELVTDEGTTTGVASLPACLLAKR
jgi:hypothetical protein